MFGCLCSSLHCPLLYSVVLRLVAVPSTSLQDLWPFCDHWVHELSQHLVRKVQSAHTRKTDKWTLWELRSGQIFFVPSMWSLVSPTMATVGVAAHKEQSHSFFSPCSCLHRYIHCSTHNNIRLLSINLWSTVEQWGKMRQKKKNPASSRKTKGSCCRKKLETFPQCYKENHSHPV